MSRFDASEAFGSPVSRVAMRNPAKPPRVDNVRASGNSNLLSCHDLSQSLHRIRLVLSLLCFYPL